MTHAVLLVTYFVCRRLNALVLYEIWWFHTVRHRWSAGLATFSIFTLFLCVNELILCFYVCKADGLKRQIKYFLTELNWKCPRVRFQQEKPTKNIIRHHWQEDVYLQNLQLLLVIQNAAYWLLILAVKCWFWRHPKAVTIFQTWQCQTLSLHLVYSCLSWGNHLNRFYFDKQKAA